MDGNWRERERESGNKNKRINEALVRPHHKKQLPFGEGESEGIIFSPAWKIPPHVVPNVREKDSFSFFFLI